MEIFEVVYKGKKIKGIKKDKGNIYVKLPIRYGKQGSQIHESISRDSKGWKFSSTLLNDFERSFNLWIRDDGRIACYNSKIDKITVTRDIFDPNSPNMGKLNDLIIELYKTVEQLKAYENRDIPAPTIKKLRMIKLLSTLKLLGFSGIDDVKSELDDSKVYFALGRIGKQLEQYINLGTYVHVEGKENDEDIIRVNVPEEMNREEFIKLVEPVKDEYSTNTSFMQEQDEKREQKRGIIPDYCEGASKKIPYSDWLIYSSVVKQTAKLLLELNADLLSQKDELGIHDLSKVDGTDLEDRISLLIDSKDFAKACDIEIRFLVREAERLVREVDSLLNGMDEETRKTSVARPLEELRDEEIGILTERNREIAKKEEGIGLDD